MSDIGTRRLRVTIWLLLALLLVMLAVPVFADEGHGHHDDDGDTIVENVLTGGDVSTGVSTRGGIAVGGSDMEIADSLATHSILFGLWQGTHTNPYTEADKLEANGKYEAAAKMRCSTKKYRKVYGKGQDCIDAVIYVEPDVPRETSQDKERLDALYARMAAYEDEYIQRVEKAEKVAQKANATAIRAEQRAVSQYGITEEQRQELAEVFKQ